MQEEIKMIQRLSHTTIYVTDQDAARDFYVNKLGFELRMDQSMGEFRWLTVGPKGQPELEIILMKVGANTGNDPESAAQLKHMLETGKLGAAGVFDIGGRGILAAAIDDVLADADGERHIHRGFHVDAGGKLPDRSAGAIGAHAVKQRAIFILHNSGEEFSGGGGELVGKDQD